MSKIPSFKPVCPKHGCPLDGLPFPLTPKGVGMCPVSGCSFEYEVELDDTKMVKDKDGNMTKKIGWNVNGSE